MATFDFGTMKNKAKKSGSQDYGFLIDQLSILENSLATDGKLSPGDYDLLNKKAQELYAHPGLTPDQRSNVSVKISSYKKQKGVESLRDNSDITTINNDMKSENAKQVMLLANNPTAFLSAKAATLRANANQLADSIDRLDAAGDDSSSQYNSYIAITGELQNTLQALNDVQNYKAGQPPTSNYAAYMVTNSRGEIVDLKVDRIGNQNGYNETNGVYAGLPIYGKLNRKDQQGNKIFQLGNKTFTASDISTPNADGSMKPSVLVDTTMQKNLKGGISISTAGYSDVDPTTVKPQQAAAPGSFLEGTNGFFYQQKEDGSYTKFTNTSKEKLMERFNLTDGDFQRVPKQYESGMIRSVKETDDGSIPIAMPLPTDMNAGTTTPSGSLSTTTPQNNAAQDEQQGGIFGKGRPNTGGAPTERAPFSASGIASKAIGAAKGFFGKVFGQ